MQLADVLLHPARQEPLGRVLLEASASALPIVTTQVGGSPEILVGPLAAANLFPVGHNKQMAERIVQLSGDRDLRHQIGHEQRETALHRFSIEHCEDSLEQAYFYVLDPPDRAIDTLEE